MFRKTLTVMLIVTLCGAGLMVRTIPVGASSHREAPLISMDPLADSTDLYAFVSPDRPDTLTIIANYIPMETPAGGPNFWRFFDPNVAYEIHIDNNGDGDPDISYHFRFQTTIANPNTFLTHLGPAATGSDGTAGGDAVIRSLNDPDYNVKQTMSIVQFDQDPNVRGYSGTRTTLATGLMLPPFNIGPGATPGYEANLGSRAVYEVGNGIKVFAGERDDPFFADLGAIFDRLELRPLGLFGDPRGRDSLSGFAVHSICMQIPIKNLTRNKQTPSGPLDANAVIGVFTTAARMGISTLRTDGRPADLSGTFVRVSRLGNPLVNELFSNLGSKDRWNSSLPSEEISFRQMQVVTPEVPALLDLLYGTNTATSGVVAKALKPFPTTNRSDLELILFKGIPVNAVTGPNYTTVIGGDLSRAAYADLLRVNLAIPPNIFGSLPDMNNPGVRRLGILGGDAAGFPNGRRLFDDVIDIFLRAAAAGTPFTPLLFPNFSSANGAPNNALTDGVDTNPEGFLSSFPYVQAPISGFDDPHAKTIGQ